MNRPATSGVQRTPGKDSVAASGAPSGAGPFSHVAPVPGTVGVPGAAADLHAAHGGGDGNQRWEGNYQFSPADGSNLELREFSVRSLEANQVGAERCAVGRVRGSQVTLDQSATGLLLGRDVTMSQSGGGVLAGGKVNVERSGAQWLIGGLVQAKEVFAVTVIAGRIEGQVKCLFDARGAFAFGAGLALMSGLLRWTLFRRR
jgi:hypothetical protein